jgi:hypothetical protein
VTAANAARPAAAATRVRGTHPILGMWDENRLGAASA